jgi:hypothetical protein
VKVRLIAEIAVGVSALAAVGIWRNKVWHFVVRRSIWFLEGDSFFSLLETFFNEAAVLWFVFPVLDTIYRIKRAGETEQQPNILVIVGTSTGAAMVFFIAAVIAKKYAEKRKG